ncbi:MAG TPA: hypothetical protein VNH46_05070, partial [Gemmatimonadales bacterium]|nr:hypothetical protein [Gemmatimonadales bacterium]
MALPLLRKIGQYGVASGFPALVNFTTMAVLTHLLSRVEYGTFALVQAAVAVVNAVGFQWLRSGVRRFLPAAGAARPAVLAAAGLGFTGLVGLVLVVALAALALPTRPLPPVLLGLGFLLLAAQAWYELNLEIVLADVSPRRYGVAGLSRAVLNGVIGAGLAAAGFGVVG